MKSCLTIFLTGVKGEILASIAFVIATVIPAFSQSDTNLIHYAGKSIFLNGINVAWVNFASDLGPGAINAAQFNKEFQTVHANGGNALRIWLHTNGSQTPVYNTNGYVTGPGSNTIQNLRTLLGLAKQNDVGLILSLWSFDMLRVTELDTARLRANINMLTDTSYTMAYIRNALVPIVDSVKGDSSIIAWEVFNEPNGMTTGMNYYPADPTVSMKAIQISTNLIAGAIHRADLKARVTTGPSGLQTLTDVQPPAGSQIAALKTVNSLSQDELKRMTDAFNGTHRGNLTSQQMLEYLDKTTAIADSNYYRDDRLVAAGGDTLGKLDFYTFHYYNYSSSIGSFSPFTNPVSYWKLGKPIALGEFLMQTTDGIGVQNLLPSLYKNGYAGGLVWSWTDFPSNNSSNPAGYTNPNAASDTWQALWYMFMNYRNNINLHPKTGSVYLFTATQSVIQKTDNTYLKWDVEPGSVIKLSGADVSSTPKDSMEVQPLKDSTYTLIAMGNVSDTATVKITVLPTGRIMSFKVTPLEIGTGENTSVIWQVVKGSNVKLNGTAVPVKDSLVVYPDSVGNTLTLTTQGDENDSSTITVTVLPPDQVDRAFGAAVTVSSNDTVAWSFSNPQNIVDENNFSRWQAGSGTSQWVQLDLGRTDSINSIIIRWGNEAYAKQYSIQSSTDLTTWSSVTRILSGTGGANYVETLSGLQGRGRYLEFILQAEGNGPYSIAEIYVYGKMITTGIVETTHGVPAAYSLSQNYPNPFNPATTIKFAIPKSGQVSLIIYNVLGQKVADLINERMSAGNFQVEFDASRLSSGVYFYVLRSGSYSMTKKMMVLK